MCRCAYTLKKVLAGFLAMAILAGEITAAQLAPILSPSLMRPPSMRPGAPVPAMPPRRSPAPRKTPVGRGPSLFEAMGGAASRKAARMRSSASSVLARPAQNWAIYRYAYGPRISSFLGRPARNWAVLSAAVSKRLGRHEAKSRDAVETRKKAPVVASETSFRVFFGEAWEGVQAVCGGLAGLLKAPDHAEPAPYPVLSDPVPAARGQAFGSLIAPAPFAPAEERKSSLDYVVIERRARYAAPPLLGGQGEHWRAFMTLLFATSPDRRTRERFGLWTQPDSSAWTRALDREGAMPPRFSSFYLREPEEASGASGGGRRPASGLLTFFRGYPGFLDAPDGEMLGLYTDLSGAAVPLRRAVPAGGNRVELILLDGSKKAMEIMEVKELSPLVFDLDGDGKYTGGRKVRFDLDADGRGDLLNDIAPGDALLVFDADGNGTSGENGRELFGDLTDMALFGEESGYRDGFASLAVLVRRAAEDGVIARGALESGRLSRADLAAMEKAYGLKAKLGSFSARPVSLSAAGIVEIAVSDKATTFIRDFDGRGNHLTRRDGADFTREDGSTGSYGDVWFKYLPGSFDPALAS